MAKQVKKRNGSIVDFDAVKITNAMRNAFRTMEVPVSEDQLADMTRGIVRQIEDRFPEQTPSVEQIQDIVEMTIMGEGYHAVAKHYIVYRYEHTKIREIQKQETLEKIEEEGITITTASGKMEKFSEERVKSKLGKHIKGVDGIDGEVNVEEILSLLKYELYENITTKEIDRALIMVVRSMIERDPAYSRLAARLLLARMYTEVFGEFDSKELLAAHATIFKRNVEDMVKRDLLDARMLEFDFEKLSAAIDPSRDYLFEYMGLEIMSSRYCMEDPDTKKQMETPQMLWMRIAMGTALNEPVETRTETALEFYDILSTFYYTPGGRTLFQAGAKKAQLSNCFLNTVPDSLDAIFKTYSDNAQYLKWSGGTGTDWTSLRATGAFIKGTGVGSQGIIPFLKIANDVNVAINRSGKRRGAGCVYLETWHLDIEDFLELRKNTGDERRRTHDINTANWIPDLFMKRVRDNGTWTLFSPDEVSELHEIYGEAFEKRYEEYEAAADRGEIKLYKRIPAQDLWKKMLAMLFETGHPWITWKDPSNVRSPQDHVGVVHNSNLCCMTADQRVVTSEGLVTVGYLYGKARMLGHVSDDGTATRMNGSTNTVFGRSGPVAAGPMLLPRPNAPIVQIVTREGYTHKVTPDHKVWVVDRGWVEAQELRQGDKIETQHSEGMFGQTDAPHDAYVCGIVAGDGTFMTHTNGSSSVCIDVWANEFSLIEEIETVGAAMLATGGQMFHTTSKRTPRFTGTAYKKRLTSAPLARVLEKRGFTRETKLQVPEFVWTGTRETVAAYLRGLYAADGTVQSSGEVTTCSLASHKRAFLEEIQIVLANFGVTTSLRQIRAAGTVLLPNGHDGRREYPQNELWRLMVTSIQGCRIMEEITGLGALRGNTTYLENLRKDGYAQKLYATFEELVSLPSEDAYCLQVLTDEHSWTVNGLVTKNTEITLNTAPNETAVCNIGSINFAKFVVDGKFDQELVGRVVMTAMRMLDNIIDLNYYPTEDARSSNMRHRPVGIGVRGYHDALYALGINFDTPEAVAFANESMEIVAYYAILGSSKLAKERGAYETYKGSKWDRNIFPQDTMELLAKERSENIDVHLGGKLDWVPVREHVKQYGMRNSNTMAIAPTASTANLVGCIPCVEPIYKNIYVKSNKEGEFIVVNKYLIEDLKSLGLWSREMLEKIKYADGSVQNILEIPEEIRAKYKEVFEIDARWLIDAAAERGKWMDQSQSLNIFFAGTSGRELSDIYFYAWQKGLKTTYYLRTLGASQVEKATVSTASFGSTHTRKVATVATAAATAVVVEETVAPIEQEPLTASAMAAKLARVASGEEVGICESCES